MTFTDNMTYGVVGTAISATGATMSVTEVQAIVSIIITVLGFIIGVVIPGCIKIYKKIKEIKADGKVTKEEIEDLKNTVQEEGQKVIDGGKEVIDKIEKDKKK